MQFPYEKYIKMKMDFLKFEGQYDTNFDPSILPKNIEEAKSFFYFDFKSKDMYMIFDNSYDIVAFVGYKYLSKEDRVRISTLYVDPDHRCRGLATELLEYCEKIYCKNYKAKTISINVFRKNTNAFELYKKLALKKYNLILGIIP